MFSTLRTRFGIPGVISVIALVFAMFGGAYAASNSASGGKATASAKAKKGPRGPKGATGPAGPQGSAGPQGPKGDAGAAGNNGSNGTPGKSVTVAEVEPGKFECEERGGAIVKAEGASSGIEVCNGKDGEEGSPWTAGGTLPPGETETGAFAATITGVGYAAAPFNIPLAAPIAVDHAIFINSGAAPAECENPDHVGTASAENPEADPGYFCAFLGITTEGIIEGITNPGTVSGGTSANGAVMELGSNFAGKDNMAGTWAVTAAP